MKIAILVPDNRDELRLYSDPEPYFGPAPTALLSGLVEMPECELHIVCCVQHPLRSPPLLPGNIHYHSLLVPKWGWLRGAYLGCLSAIRRKLREIKPDLVHGQGTERYCALGAVYSGFPNVVTIHGNMRQMAKVAKAPPFSFPWLTAQLERWTLPRTQGVLCNSIHTYQQVSPFARTTWMVPNALREIFFSPRQGSPGSPPVLLNVGHITPNKSQHELFDLAARLHQRNAIFQMQFVGQLDQRAAYGAEFLSRVNRTHRQRFACYLGQKSGRELVELMDRASGLIHFPKEESFGLVVAEGLARNLKLFSARVGGIIDIAAGVEGAEVFDPLDLAGMEASVLRWLSTGSPTLGHAAEQMRNRYHPAVIARLHLEIYRHVLRSD